MSHLNYKASNIAKTEKENKLNFLTVLSELQANPSFSNLLFLFKAGGGTEEEFDELAKTGIPEVTMEIMEGISDAGFLGTKIDTKKMRADMEEELENKRMMAEAFKESVESIAASENSGEKTND